MQNTTWKLFHCYKAVLLTIRSSERPKRSGQRVEFLLDMVGHSSRKEVRVPYRLCETKDWTWETSFGIVAPLHTEQKM